MGGAVLTAIKGRRGGGRSWFTRTTLRVTQKPAENSPFSQVGLIVRQWGTSSLHTLRQGKREEKQMGFFEFVGPVQHLNCVFIIISDILFLVKSLLSTYVPGPSSCLSHVSYLNTENMFFQSSVFSTSLPKRHLGCCWTPHYSLAVIHINDSVKPTINQWGEARSFFLALMLILKSSRPILWTCPPCESQCEMSRIWHKFGATPTFLEVLFFPIY